MSANKQRASVTHLSDTICQIEVPDVGHLQLNLTSDGYDPDGGRTFKWSVTVEEIARILNVRSLAARASGWCS